MIAYSQRKKRKKKKCLEWGSDKWEKEYYQDLNKYRRNPFL